MKTMLHPLLAALSLSALAIASPAWAAPTKVVALGDSLTEGYGVAKEAAWPELLQAELKKKGYAEVTVVNAGISGSTTASAVQRMKWQLASKPKPDVVILALGANDGLRGLTVEDAKKNLLAAIKLAKDAGVTVLLAGMKMPPNLGKQYVADFEAIFPDLAKSESVPLIPFLLEGVAADPKLNLADGIHPNEAGYKIVTETVLKHLTPLLKK